MFLLRRTAIASQYFHVASVGRAAIENLGCPEDATHDFSQRCVLEDGQAGTEIAVGLRQKQVPEAGFLGTWLELPEDGWFCPAIACIDLLAKKRLIRIDEFIHKRQQAFAEFLYLG